MVHLRGEIDAAIVNVSSAMEAMLERINDRVLIAQDDGSLVCTRLQAAFGAKFPSQLEQIVHQVMVSHAMDAERCSPGGFDTCLENVTKKLRSSTGGSQRICGSKFFDGQFLTTRAMVSDLGWVVSTYASGVSAQVRSVIESSLRLAGFAGRIIVERTDAKPSVELVNGYAFDVAPAWPIRTSIVSPRVIVIDGMIESVSEVHHLLLQASESKEYVVLFVRGMSDDVKQTLRVNNNRGTFRIIPIVAAFDIEGINTLNDVSIVTGADLVSSLKGNLISSVRLDDASWIDELIIRGDSVVVINKRTAHAAHVHASFLREKRARTEDKSLAALYDSRIRSVSSRHVIVRLRNDIDFVASSQAFDYTLRAVRSLVEHGVSVVDGRRTLAATLAAADAYASSCVQALCSLGAVIYAT